MTNSWGLYLTYYREQSRSDLFVVLTFTENFIQEQWSYYHTGYKKILAF